MKRLILVSASILTLGIGSSQAIAYDFDLTANVPASCTFGTIDLNAANSSTITFSTTDFTNGVFSKSVPIGGSSCNAYTTWTLESEKGGLEGPVVPGFNNLIEYEATLNAGVNNNVGVSSGSSSNIASLSPFIGAMSLSIISNSITPSTFSGGTYEDKLIITFALN